MMEIPAMVQTPVIWHSQDDGRGYYNCTQMLNDAFDLQGCVHYPGWKRMPLVDGAVVVVHGGRELGRLERLKETRGSEMGAAHFPW
jgi:hypothetical protein